MYAQLKPEDIKQMLLRPKRTVVSAFTMSFRKVEETLSIGLIKLSFCLQV